MLMEWNAVERRYPNNARVARGNRNKNNAQRRNVGSINSIRRSRSFLCISVCPLYPFLERTEHFLRRYVLHVEVYRNKPSAQYVGEMMEHVRVSDAVDGSVRGDGEQEDVGEEGVARLDARDHAASAEGFDEEDERHDR
jgi:hypothetical protein